MATVRIDRFTDMVFGALQSATDRIAYNENSIVFDPFPSTASTVLTGVFSVDPVISGVVTNIASAPSGLGFGFYQISNVNADAASLVSVMIESRTDGFRYVLSGSDDIFGGNNEQIPLERLKGYAGNDTIDGGTSASLNDVDGSYYDGLMAEYSIIRVDEEKFTVEDGIAGRDGIDSLVNIERLSFSDFTLAFDEGVLQIDRLYRSFLDRAPDIDGISYWVKAKAGSVGLRDVAYGFFQSAEYQGVYGNYLDNGDFVTVLYEKILDRMPSSADLSYWVGQLDSGADRMDVIAAMSESAEHRAKLKTVADAGILLDSLLVA